MQNFLFGNVEKVPKRLEWSNIDGLKTLDR